MLKNTYGHSDLIIQLSFERTAQNRDPNGKLSKEELRAYCDRLREKHYIYIQNKLIHVPLSRDYMGGAATIAREVAANPVLAKSVVFSGGGLPPRPYNDVVWDLSERGLELSRTLYKEQQRGEMSPIRVFITTPALGQDAGALHCRTIDVQDKNKASLMIGVRLEGFVPASPAGTYIVQSDEYRLDGIDGNMAVNRHLDLAIRTKPSSIRSWSHPQMRGPDHVL